MEKIIGRLKAFLCLLGLKKKKSLFWQKLEKDWLETSRKMQEMKKQEGLA